MTKPNMIELIGDFLTEQKYNGNKTKKDREDLYNAILAEYEKDWRFQDVKRMFNSDNQRDYDYLQCFKRSEYFDEFLVSPASRSYHGAREGGLFDHSVAVFKAALELSDVICPGHTSAAACLLHDICKVGLYKFNPTTKKYDYNNDHIAAPHGSESLRRILHLDDNECPFEDQLPEAWEVAIIYHMGAFMKDEAQTYGNACEKHPEVLLLHTADMLASKVWGF